MSQPLSNHRATAFVTGASSGIGRAIAEKLLVENHRVWGTSRDPARLAGLTQKYPATFTPVTLNLDNPDDAQATFAALWAEATSKPSQSAGFDIVINNAGYGGTFAPYAETDFALWRRQIDAMLTTTARLSHTALRGMISRNQGVLANVSSLVVNFPLPYMSAYNTAKAGLSALNESLIYETRGTNIAIIDFRPGDYRTDFNNAMAGLRPEVTSDKYQVARNTAPQSAEDSLATCHLPLATSRDEVARTWRTIDAQFNAAPLPDRAARDLYRAIQRHRSGTVRSGTFFQARLAPLAARLLPATLMRALQARYFGAT